MKSQRQGAMDARETKQSGHRRPAGSGDPPMTLTRVRNPDHELLVELQEYDLEAFGATGLRTYDLAVMAQAGAVFVARIADDIVGGCQLMRVLDEPDFFYIVGFYIRPEWRGRRLGGRLLHLLAEESRALGAKGLVLTTAPDNLAALALYKGAGFVEDRFVPHFYGEKEDRYILRWRFPAETEEVAEEGLRGGV
jgi:ribosomal protein S18 acetylase RimI-like enzyme